ncbi:MAG: VacJ family lipoprotein [Cetobacterium sp.]|uniref:MlaA family lipoprotein n=1 Tax=Cetobacterium sp. TaxID=2071632 RepID=UPI002FC7A18D
MKINKILISIVMVLSLSSCNNVEKIEESDYRGRNIEFTEITEQDVKDTKFLAIYDPVEPFNRRMYYFNYYLDKYFLIPVVNTYEFVTPTPLQKGVNNFFNNFQNVSTFANSILQFKLGKAAVTALRFGVNSTVGILGLFDVATDIGLPKTYEDLGLTLAYYGVGNGPYLVLPGYGPTNLRDITGKAVGGVLIYEADIYHPLDFRADGIEGGSLYAINTRKNTKSFRYYGTGTPFEYEYVRFFYTTYRDILKDND